MIIYDEAKKIVQQSIATLAQEELSVIDAVGRIASKNVLSCIANPRFRNSSMDGYALVSKTTECVSEDAPGVFRVLGCSLAGDRPFDLAQIEDADALEVMTGAIVPEQFDAVVRVEDTKLLEGGRISLSQPLPTGANIREAGEDFSVGTDLLHRGDRLQAGHAMLLAANGIATVSVFRKPKVVVISTGKELVDVTPGRASALENGEIYNSSAPYLRAALKQLDCEVLYSGVVRDDPAAFVGQMEGLLAEKPDVIITTGAVSMGKADFVPVTLRDLGGEILFHKVGVRPGKPLLFGVINKSGRSVPFFGLPGNPLSVVAGVRFFFYPYLRSLQKRPEELSFKALLKSDYQKPEHLRCFCPGVLNRETENAEVALDPTHRSFMLTPTVESDVWAILPEGEALVPAGHRVECVRFFPEGC